VVKIKAHPPDQTTQREIHKLSTDQRSVARFPFRATCPTVTPQAMPLQHTHQLLIKIAHRPQTIDHRPY
jgi:hypothetical protein